MRCNGAFDRQLQVTVYRDHIQSILIVEVITNPLPYRGYAELLQKQ